MKEPDADLEKMINEAFEDDNEMQANPKKMATIKQLFKMQIDAYAGQKTIQYPPFPEQDCIVDTTKLRKVSSDKYKNLKPMEGKIKLDFKRCYSEKEHERMSFGLMPASMDEKWLIIMDETGLRFYRSWTNEEKIRLFLEHTKVGYVVKETWVDEEMMRNEWNSPNYMAKLLNYIIERMLLGRYLEFPFPDNFEGTMQRLMLRSAMVGSSLANGEE